MRKPEFFLLFWKKANHRDRDLLNILKFCADMFFYWNALETTNQYFIFALFYYQTISANSNFLFALFCYQTISANSNFLFALFCYKIFTSYSHHFSANLLFPFRTFFYEKVRIMKIRTISLFSVLGKILCKRRGSYCQKQNFEILMTTL